MVSKFTPKKKDTWSNICDVKLQPSITSLKFQSNVIHSF